MKIYKDTSNNIHEIDSIEFEYLLPAGSVAITQAEADAIRAPTAEEQAIIDEALRVQEIKEAALTRITVAFPAITTLEQLDFCAEFWKSIAVGSRAPTVDFQYVLDVYTTAKAAIVNGIQLGAVVWP